VPWAGHRVQGALSYLRMKFEHGHMLVAIAFISIGLFVGLSGWMLYLIYAPIKRRLLRSGKLTTAKSKLINFSYILFLICFSMYQTYFALYPHDSFYVDEFEENTGLALPSSAVIVEKDSSYPDTHGDYWAAAAIELSPVEFANLNKAVQASSAFKLDTANRIGVTSEYRITFSDDRFKAVSLTYGNINKEWFKVAFLKDGKTILFERSSS